MQEYFPNSPQAMSRIIAMMIVTDAHIDDREIDALDQSNAYALLGLSRQEFMLIARDYCSDLVAEAEEYGESALLDPDRTDRIIECVDVREKRQLVARLLIGIVGADKTERKSERIVLHHILDRWGMSREEIAASITRTQATT